jgi:hypothetical protein
MSVPTVGFKPTISAGERPQIYALDRAATGTGQLHLVLGLIISLDNLYADLCLHGVRRNNFYICVISLQVQLLLLQKLKLDFIQLHKIDHFLFVIPKMFSKSKTGF